MTTDISLHLESFELQIQDIAAVDITQIHALSIGVRWPHRPDDWTMLRQLGRGIAAVDEIGRVVGSAMWFPYGPDFVTVGMVITSPRLQEYGTGRWLMDHILNEIGPRVIGLNSTRAALRLYKSLGFVAQRTIYQCQGEAALPPPVPVPQGASLRQLIEDDLSQIISVDHVATGVDRSVMLAHVVAQSKGIGLFRNDCLEAFALCRPFGRGHVVGPLVARSDIDAIAVMAPHVADHAGRFLRIDTAKAEGPFAGFIANAGLSTFDTVTAMTRGAKKAAEKVNGDYEVYGLTSQALS